MTLIALTVKTARLILFVFGELGWVGSRASSWSYCLAVLLLLALYASPLLLRQLAGRILLRDELELAYRATKLNCRML